MSTSAEPTPVFDELADGPTFAHLWAESAHWDVEVGREPEPWGMGPTPLALLMDRLLAAMDPREAQTIRESAEAQMSLARALDAADAWNEAEEEQARIYEEVNHDGDEGRPVPGAGVDQGSEGPVVVGGDGPGDRVDQG